MLEKIFTLTFWGIACGIICWLVYVFSLMWRFLIKIKAVEKLYEICKPTMTNYFSWSTPLEAEYKDRVCKAKIRFSNSLEVCEQIEALIEDALKCYDRLRDIAIYVEGMEEDKKILENISKDIKQKKEKIQGKGA